MGCLHFCMDLSKGDQFHVKDVKELCNLGKFLINAYKLRENLNRV